MPLLLIVLVFVTAALYLRSRFGIGALAALWAMTSILMAFTDSALFAEMFRRSGSATPSAGRGLVMTFMLFLMATSFGACALAIQRYAAREGPWWTTKGFIIGVFGFVAGGAVAYGIVVLMIILVVSRMAP